VFLDAKASNVIVLQRRSGGMVQVIVPGDSTGFFFLFSFFFFLFSFFFFFPRLGALEEFCGGLLN